MPEGQETGEGDNIDLEIHTERWNEELKTLTAETRHPLDVSSLTQLDCLLEGIGELEIVGTDPDAPEKTEPHFVIKRQIYGDNEHRAKDGARSKPITYRVRNGLGFIKGETPIGTDPENIEDDTSSAEATGIDRDSGDEEGTKAREIGRQVVVYVPRGSIHRYRVEVPGNITMRNLEGTIHINDCKSPVVLDHITFEDQPDMQGTEIRSGGSVAVRADNPISVSGKKNTFTHIPEGAKIVDDDWGALRIHTGANPTANVMITSPSISINNPQ